MMSVPEVRAQALASARSAAKRGFASEPNIEWLMRRAWIAALRSLARSGHSQAARLADEWAPGAFRENIDWAALPADGPVEPLLRNREGGYGHPGSDLVDFFDAVHPLVDEPEGRLALRRIGIRSTWVLRATGDGDEWLVSRCTLDNWDRWFYNWDGSAQGFNYTLYELVPATRKSRQHEAAAWAGELPEFFVSLDHVEVHGDIATFQAVRNVVQQRWPATKLGRATTE